MKIEQVAKREPIKQLLYWIKERESIRLKKKEGQKLPWTDDVILQQYRFCNVRRMDDKVSQWLLKNWYEPNKGHKNMLIACGLARFINLPESLEAIGFPRKWNPEWVKKVLHTRKLEGRKVFNAAYIVSTNGMKKDKIDYVVDDVLCPLYSARQGIVDPSSLANTWENLIVLNGIGSFMGGQISADLRWAVKGSWADRHSWAPVGPGSRRGLHRLLKREITAPLRQLQFLEELQWVISTAKEGLPRKLTSRLEAIDYQNCLCEFDGYERALQGGRKKQRYPGGVSEN